MLHPEDSLAVRRQCSVVNAANHGSVDKRWRPIPTRPEPRRLARFVVDGGTVAIPAQDSAWEVGFPSRTPFGGPLGILK
jgi:hypothetical protein